MIRGDVDDDFARAESLFDDYFTLQTFGLQMASTGDVGRDNVAFAKTRMLTFIDVCTAAHAQDAARRIHRQMAQELDERLANGTFDRATFTPATIFRLFMQRLKQEVGPDDRYAFWVMRASSVTLKELSAGGFLQLRADLEQFLMQLYRAKQEAFQAYDDVYPKEEPSRPDGGRGRGGGDPDDDDGGSDGGVQSPADAHRVAAFQVRGLTQATGALRHTQSTQGLEQRAALRGSRASELPSTPALAGTARQLALSTGPRRAAEASGPAAASTPASAGQAAGSNPVRGASEARPAAVFSGRRPAPESLDRGRAATEERAGGLLAGRIEGFAADSFARDSAFMPEAADRSRATATERAGGFATDRGRLFSAESFARAPVESFTRAPARAPDLRSELSQLARFANQALVRRPTAGGVDATSDDE